MIAQLLREAVRHHEAGRLPDAEALYRQVLHHDPLQADALHGLGLVALQTGRAADAVELIRRAAEAKPGAAAFHNDLGLALRAAGRAAEAVAAHRRGLYLRPGDPEAHNNLGLAFMASGETKQAADHFRQAVGLAPGHAKYHANAGAALIAGDRPGEAVKALRESLRLRPEHPGVLANLGVALSGLGRAGEAVDSLRQAVAKDPRSVDSHRNLGLALLAAGELAEGFAEYEWRWRATRGPFAPRGFHQPRWRGEDARGATILLHAEQGMGDAINWARYVPLAAERVGPAGRVVLECHPPLVPLLADVPGAGRVVARGDALPPFDAHCPLCDLPAAFGTTLQTIPGRVPYLSPDPAKAAAWADRFNEDARPGLRVGLVWAGNPLQQNDRHRSCRLDALAPLAGVPGVRFYSLQVGAAAGQARRPPAGMELIDLSADLRDFSDTAAAVANFGLVITVDTAVAHLAGALGRPVWTMLTFAPDWRWMLGREDTPWYPTMRLFRQPAAGDWDAVARRVAAELAAAAAPERVISPGEVG